MSVEFAAVHGPAAPPARALDKIFALLVVYYWSLQFLQGDSVEILPIEIRYYLYVAPAVAFAIGGALYMMMTAHRLSASTLTLFMFLVVTVGTSLARSDWRTIASIGLLAVTLMILFETRLRVRLNLINVLFCCSFVLTTLLYYFEYSVYTFIPGVGRQPDLWWRISPLPSVSEGGLFATVVFIMNAAFRGQMHRGLMLGLSLYFLILSGNRTSIFAVAVCGVYLLLRQSGRLIRPGTRAAFAIAALSIFLLSVLDSRLLLQLPFADSEILRTLIFREEAIGRFDVGGQLGTAAVRQWIFDQHLAAFRESPLVGIGTFDFRLLNTGYGALDDATTGSEAFVTGLLARIGLLSLFLFAALFTVRQPVTGDAADLSVCARMTLLIAMITYGSFVNVYDVVFLLLVLAIAGCVDPTRAVRTDERR